MARQRKRQKKETRVWSIHQIMGMLDAGTLFFNPVVQRPYVWASDEKKSKLIDSIIMDYSTSVMYANVTVDESCKGRSDKKYDVFDGQQRLKTICLFRQNAFALKGLDPIELEDGGVLDLNGKTYDELPEDIKADFEKAVLTLYVYKDLSIDQELEMYNRINSGQPISKTELLRTKCPSNTKIMTLAANPLFAGITDAEKRSSFHYDIVMKAIMLLYGDSLALTGKPFETFFTKLQLSDEQAETVKATLTYMADTAAEMEIKDRKLFMKKTNLVSFIPVARRAALAEKLDTERFAGFVLDFLKGENEEYKAAMLEGSAKKTNVEARLSTIMSAYTDFIRN